MKGESSLTAQRDHHASGVEWLGPIPKHWFCRHVKYLAKVRLSNIDKHTVEGEQQVGLCNYLDVYNNEKITSKLTFMIATAAEEQIKRLSLKIDDVIITKDSEDPRDIGVPSHVVEHLPNTVCGYHLALLSPSSTTSGSFLAYALRSHYVKAIFQVSSNGLTRYALGKYEIENTILPVPPLEEQKAIAAFLDRETAKIDMLIEKQLRLIDLLTEKRQAVISHAVTKGLDDSVPMKDTGVEWLGRVPAHWDDRRIGRLFRNVKEAGVEGLPVLSVSIHSGVSDREIDDDERDRTVSKIEDKRLYQRVRSGDLVYNMMRAWQGGFGSVLVDGLVSPSYVVARPTSELVSTYIELILRTPACIEQMRRISKGIVDFRQRLYWEEFKELRIPFPSVEEQKEIVSSIDAERKKINNLQRLANKSIDLMRERRSALISAAVTGKTNVTDLQER